jgi:hypothetical protein
MNNCPESVIVFLLTIGSMIIAVTALIAFAKVLVLLDPSVSLDGFGDWTWTIWSQVAMG